MSGMTKKAAVQGEVNPVYIVAEGFTGSGGSGTVILRYTTVDPACPNSGNATRAIPLACPASVTVQADGIAVDTTVLTGPVSFSANGATLSIVTTPTANPTSGNLLASIVNTSQIRVSVPAGSSLIGGTYPVNYRITSASGVTSESYLLVTVEDPNQVTPIRLTVDPRVSSYSLPDFPLGDATNVLLCLTENANDGYTDAVSLTAPVVSGVTAEARTRGVSWRGTRTVLQDLIPQIDLVSPTAGASLVNSNSPRVFTVNVSNTSNGGNNSCSGGTRSEITLAPLDIGTTDHLLLWFLGH